MVINLVSCPRNMSTALMYSFAQYPGMQVVDEPFYGIYLEQTGLPHPGREDVLKTMETNEQVVYADLSMRAENTAYLFLKNMSQHMAQVQHTAPWKDWKHIFYIRDPRRVIHSFAKVIPDLRLQDIGFAYMRELYDQLASTQPLILDSDVLIADPSSSLKKLYADLGLPFDEAVLHWPDGPKSYDGVWATYWYENVHNSTGFNVGPARPLPELTAYQNELYEQALENYLYLKEKNN